MDSGIGLYEVRFSSIVPSNALPPVLIMPAPKGGHLTSPPPYTDGGEAPNRVPSITAQAAHSGAWSAGAVSWSLWQFF